jgi:aryl-alcohol dehydrogenase-like predicted oxidoreductase
VQLQAPGTSTPVAIAPLINGCWQLAGGHGREVFDGLDDTLESVAKAGYTTFDSADIYGPSERLLGQFEAAWTSAGNPPLQLLTKYVPNIFQGGAPSPAAVEGAIRRSLANLQVCVCVCVFVGAGAVSAVRAGGCARASSDRCAACAGDTCGTLVRLPCPPQVPSLDLVQLHW